MSKAKRAKKQRRANRKFAQASEEAANRAEREGKAPAEFITAVRDVAVLYKQLGSISGRKKLKGKKP